MTKAKQRPAEELPGYRDEKQVARDGDSSARCALASRADTRPEILYYLAEDPDIEVRCRIAENAETPRQADILLARDECDEVRSVLATKIGRMFPEVSATERSVMRRTVLDILELLAADQTKHVRELVSDALKNAPDVPPHVIRQLATDPHLTVCGPILEFSPVLTEEDLLEIISSKPVQGALSAASRRTSLGELVSDAIAATNDTDAIGELLANPSAQIREETLDGLIESAPAFESWHAPLVNRPKLPANAARRIAGFVAQSFLDRLRARTDLEQHVLDAVEIAVRERLSEVATHETTDNRWLLDPEKKKNGQKPCSPNPERRARELNQKGKLSENIIGTAAAASDRNFVMAALAECADEDLKMVRRIFEMRSSKGIVAICWKSKMSMELAVHLQATIGNIAPGTILSPKNKLHFPLSEKEMQWQLKFFKSKP
jgi:uncharacterized protein (DUF2336 family)